MRHLNELSKSDYFMCFHNFRASKNKRDLHSACFLGANLFYLHVYVPVCMHAGAWSLEEDFGSPGAGVTGDPEPPDAGLRSKLRSPKAASTLSC